MGRDRSDAPRRGREQDAAPETPGLPHSDPGRVGFVPASLDRTVIAVPLLNELNEERRTTDERRPRKVIVDLNREYAGGADGARARATDLIARAVDETGRAGGQQGVNEAKSRLSDQYLFATLDGDAIRALVRLDGAGASARGDAAPGRAAQAIHRIWPDFAVGRLTTRSVSTVKADAARIAFAALGEDITWAVVDSGIQGDHPHFAAHGNLALRPPLEHVDFTGGDAPLADTFGHGTHVAGIIAGELTAGRGRQIRAVARYRDEDGEVTHRVLKPDSIAGMAPRCRLVSLKVLGDDGDGETSSLIAALEHVQRVNGYGRRLRIHGVNMSVGYSFEPEWFACGQSPLCVEVDRLVRSGVVVVVAAGNTGYGWAQSAFRGTVAAGADLTINDPGNAALAITVGSTHRDSPHVYGVSYFSSKGPTGDGRPKPDLVAPGEKILSCAAGVKLAEAMEEVGTPRGRQPATVGYYAEDSGTSMAAPHVSGVIAAFLSIRGEFVGRPEAVKEVFLSTATDLKRERSFQGHGLVDLMRAIQSV